MTAHDQPAYVMGYTDHERSRLVMQSLVQQPLLDGLLSRAGISTGMRVLDFGCGVGDVSFTAARLVGRTGNIIGGDRDREALAIARSRAREQGLDNIEFVCADIGEYQTTLPVDAVT